MAQSTPLKPASILVVESEALIRRELADRLADMGLDVTEAADADEAISHLNAHLQIEMLYTDVRMPGSMDGVRLAHLVRSLWPPVEIIVGSGEKRLKPLDLPLDSVVLAKPFGPEALYEAVTELTRKTSCRLPGFAPIRNV